MAFWQEFTFPSTVDKLLETESWTLEQLLDQDDALVDDARDRKPKLLAMYYSSKNINWPPRLKPNVEKLVSIVVGETIPAEPHQKYRSTSVLYIFSHF